MDEKEAGKMKRIILLTLALAWVGGCASIIADSADPKDTAWAVERARQYRDERPMDVKAEAYEDYLFDNFGPGDPDPWVPHRRKI